VENCTSTTRPTRETAPSPTATPLRFKPDRRELIDALPREGRPASFNLLGTTPIRFEAIDTLETHFDTGGERTHQRLDLALAQRDALLAEAGFGEVRFFDDLPFKVQSVEHHPRRAWLLASGLDTHGRTIAFVFAGDPAEEDGTRVFVTPQHLDASLNAFMLRHGHAYAAFYSTLPADLREPLREITVAARRAGTGVYAHDAATLTAAAQIADLAALQQLAIWPKLFRRLAAFFADGRTSLSQLDTWLRQDPVNRDDRVLLPNREIGNMHDLVAADGHGLRLTHLPEDVVIVPDNFVLQPVPKPVPLASSRVRIIAALVDPAGDDRGNETVTLINVSEADIPLAGWTLADAAGRQPLQGTLAHGDALRISLTGQVQLGNARDTLTLRDDKDAVVDQVAYEQRDLPGAGRTLVFDRRAA
jgi:hypothetical protein